MMKASIKMAMLNYCSHRMVSEYEKRYYSPIAKRVKALLANDIAEAKSQAVQYQRLRSHWQNIRIDPPVRSSDGPFKVGETFDVTAVVHLGEIRPEEVEVQIYYGLLKKVDTLLGGRKEIMTVQENRENGQHLYTCKIYCREAGRYGFTARAIPQGDSRLRFAPGFITWS
jgi:starch phosphorylase